MDAATYADLPRFTALTYTRNGREHRVFKASHNVLPSSPAHVVVTRRRGSNDASKVALADLRIAD